MSTVKKRCVWNTESSVDLVNKCIELKNEFLKFKKQKNTDAFYKLNEFSVFGKDETSLKFRIENLRKSYRKSKGYASKTGENTSSFPSVEGSTNLYCALEQYESCLYPKGSNINPVFLCNEDGDCENNGNINKSTCNMFPDDDNDEEGCDKTGGKMEVKSLSSAEKQQNNVSCINQQKAKIMKTAEHQTDVMHHILKELKDMNGNVRELVSETKSLNVNINALLQSNKWRADNGNKSTFADLMETAATDIWNERLGVSNVPVAIGQNMCDKTHRFGIAASVSSLPPVASILTKGAPVQRFVFN